MTRNGPAFTYNRMRPDFDENRQGKMQNENPLTLINTTDAGRGEHGRKARNLLLGATLAALALMFAPFVLGYVFGANVGLTMYRINTVLLYPLRLFITFVHESGHALAALLTGNHVASLAIKPNGEGVTMATQNFLSAWVIDSAGYLGTAIFGAVMLQVGRLRKLQAPGRTALYFASAALALITLLWGWHDPFTLAVGFGLSAACFALARFLSPAAANFAAAFIAVQCSLNAISDIGILLSLTTGGEMQNDAGNMAKTYALPATLWGAIWAATALIVLVIGLRSYWRATK